MYIICHAEKIHSIGGMASYYDRIGVYQADGSVTLEADPKNPEKTRLKYPWATNPKEYAWNRREGSEAPGMTEAWKKAVSGLSRKPQKNAAPLIEFVISASPDFFKRLQENNSALLHDHESYYQACESFF
jgi:hypothetical protein